MTERPHETDVPEFDLGRSPTAPFPEFSEWLAQHHHQYPADQQDERPAREPPRAMPESRVFGSTAPYGVFLLVTAFMAAHINGAATDATRQLIGLALITWATSLGCEMTASYFLGIDYPPWGMWAWIAHPTTRRILDRIRQRIGRATDNGVFFAVAAGLLLPSLFLGTWALLAALSIARHLWTGSAVMASALHIAVTVYRLHTWWRHRDNT